MDALHPRGVDVTIPGIGSFHRRPSMVPLSRLSVGQTVLCGLLNPALSGWENLFVIAAGGMTVGRSRTVRDPEITTRIWERTGKDSMSRYRTTGSIGRPDLEEDPMKAIHFSGVGLRSTIQMVADQEHVYTVWEEAGLRWTWGLLDQPGYDGPGPPSPYPPVDPDPYFWEVAVDGMPGEFQVPVIDYDSNGESPLLFALFEFSNDTCYPFPDPPPEEDPPPEDP